MVNKTLANRPKTVVNQTLANRPKTVVNKTLAKRPVFVWLYIIGLCSSFAGRDCNACFRQIFEETTFGYLNEEDLGR